MHLLNILHFTQVVPRASKCSTSSTLGLAGTCQCEDEAGDGAAADLEGGLGSDRECGSG